MRRRGNAVQRIPPYFERNQTYIYVVFASDRALERGGVRTVAGKVVPGAYSHLGSSEHGRTGAVRETGVIRVQAAHLREAQQRRPSHALNKDHCKLTRKVDGHGTIHPPRILAAWRRR